MENEPLRAEQISETISSMQGNISALNNEILELRTASDKAKQSWFRQPTLIISLMALLFSFGTTAVSYIRTEQQDIHDARSELRSLILRLNQLPREDIENKKKYKDDALTAGGISGLLNAENTLIAKQAADVIHRIPSNVSATEYSSVAFALSQSGLVEPALKLIKLGLSRSNDANDEVSTLRFYGKLLFIIGDLEAGREKYKAALMIFSKYSMSNQFHVQTTHALTEMYWAQMEHAARQCRYAKSHIEEARSHLSLLPPGSEIKSFEDQIRQTEIIVGACTP